jgi:hypothetical protein
MGKDKAFNIVMVNRQIAEDQKLLASFRKNNISETKIERLEAIIDERKRKRTELLQS